MFSDAERNFVERQRAGRLATAGAHGHPHVVPVCYGVEASSVYITIDEKPKTVSDRPLKRIRNILENPAVALVVDHYEEDWSRLGWVMVRGPAVILEHGAEHDRAQTLLKERYSQYLDMQLHELPVIAIRAERVTSWGNLG